MQKERGKGKVGKEGILKERNSKGFYYYYYFYALVIISFRIVAEKQKWFGLARIRVPREANKHRVREREGKLIKSFCLREVDSSLSFLFFSFFFLKNNF